MECKRLVQIFLSVLLLFAAYIPCHAQTQENLYTVVIQVTDNSSVTRNKQLPSAFEQVIRKVSSSQQLFSHPDYLAATKQIENYVNQYFYSEQGELYTLTLHFDPQMVNKLIAKTGRKTLGTIRPQVLLWIVYEDPKPNFVTHSTHENIVREINALADSYGLKVMLPLLDLAERETLSEENILNNNADAFKLAAELYRTDVILLGKMKEDNGICHGDWQLVTDSRIFNWQTTSNDLHAQLENMIKNVADNLIVAQAQNKFSQIVNIRVTDIKTANDYAKVVTYLQKLPMVKKLVTNSVGGNLADFELHIDVNGTQLLEQLKETTMFSIQDIATKDDKIIEDISLVYRMAL